MAWRQKVLRTIPEHNAGGERLPLWARLVPRQAVLSKLLHSVENGGFSGYASPPGNSVFSGAFDSILREEENPSPWVGPECASSLRHRLMDGLFLGTERSPHVSNWVN